MNIQLPVFPDVSLLLADPPAGRKPYATSRLQKGLLLIHRGQNLSEEAVGFGLPVLQAGWQTIFPGRISLDSIEEGSDWRVEVTYGLHLVEKVAQPGTGSAQSQALYGLKNALAALIRAAPLVRPPLTALSSGLRKVFRLETTYEEAGFSAQVRMTYTMDSASQKIRIEADLTSLTKEKFTEVVVMNEQGARAFDHYHDSSGLQLQGGAIGCWDEVRAETATFSSPSLGLSFILEQAAGTRLFRGREHVGSRLAWAGFGHSFPPTLDHFQCHLRIRKGP